MSRPPSPEPGHCIVQPQGAREWHDGLPLGNGELGAMVWGDGHPLRLTLDHASLWDLRRRADHLEHPDYTYAGLQRLVSAGRFAEVDEVFEQRELRDNPVGPTKVSIGRAELDLGPDARCRLGLALGPATISGSIATAAGEHHLQAFVARSRNVLCVRLRDAPPAVRMRLVPLADTSEALAGLAHPLPRRDEGEHPAVLRQDVPGGPAYAVAWSGCGPDFFLAVETATTVDEAAGRALATWQQAEASGFEALHREHLRAWEAFWAVSAVYLPERHLEFLWYFGLYLLASAARRGSMPPGLQGVWPMDGVLPPWRGDYHADMNVQETFWPAFTSGHLELADSWCDQMRASLPVAQAFTQRFFGTEGAFWVCCTLPGYTPVPCWHTVQFGWSHSGWLAWLVWLRWRHGQDREWLAATGYPLVAEVFRFYRANLVEGQDGCLHVPLSSSPEYRENQSAAWARDPTVDLALIRRCCDWVSEMEQALDRDDLSPAAQQVRARLTPYPLTDRRELCLWPDRPLDESHRHPSHLMPIHPAMDLTVDDGDDARQTIDASLEQYLALGRYRWAGHTYAQLASLAAVVGRGELAYDCLHHFREYWIGANGLHFNRDLRATGISCYRGTDRPFTLEASCGIAAGIGDMLVQGWRDVVRVFPAVPAHWRDLAFRDLLTEGAFRVSALRRDGRTVWVKVVAGVARKLCLRDPFEGAPFGAAGAGCGRQADLLVADLGAGHELTLWRADADVDFARDALRVRQYEAETAPWGPVGRGSRCGRASSASS